MKSYKRWYITFFCFLLAASMLFMAFNYIVDPFGAFGDRFLKMYNYDMSNNIRIAKISYLDENYKNFDSFIIGGSKSGALTPEIVEKYYPGASFYNLNMIGGRFYDYEKTIHYIVDNYNVKNIVFQISQLEANLEGTSKGVTGMLHGKVDSGFPLLFYVKVLMQNSSYSFKKLREIPNKDAEAASYNFYDITNGSYNYARVEKRIEAEKEKYFNDEELFPKKNPQIKNTVFEYNLEILKRIVDFCKQKRVNLLVITSPTYKAEADEYPSKEFADYMKGMASITHYWNFSGYNSVNLEKTNFYNNNHFRVRVSEMMMARIFGDNSVSIPSDFGEYVTEENAEEIIGRALLAK